MVLYDGRLTVGKVVLLFWKSVLLLFGNFLNVEESKVALRQGAEIHDINRDESFITATPLDYHLFRQEITSKYPAYTPPAPLVPIEDQNNSILPPLSTHPSRRPSQESLQVTAPSAHSANGSIFYQPVHIATPAPSPPPSPAGPGGKGGKKQNYQTNQNFPFLYPPLDETSNTIGGKGVAELQNQLVGKRWGGSDIPASILEAGQLFASRMRMTRSIRQLWDVREKYIKSERGWNETIESKNVTSSKRTNIDIDDDEVDDGNTSDGHPTGSCQEPGLDSHDKEDGPEDEFVRQRLDAINDFYVSIDKADNIIS